MSKSNLEQALLQLRAVAEGFATAGAPDQQLQSLRRSLGEVLAECEFQLELALNCLTLEPPVAGQLVGARQILQALAELREPWEGWEDLSPRLERFEQLAALLEPLSAESSDSPELFLAQGDLVGDLEVALLAIESHLQSGQKELLQEALLAVEAAERRLVSALET